MTFIFHDAGEPSVLELMNFEAIVVVVVVVVVPTDLLS
jgi:hypothetical protein